MEPKDLFYSWVPSYVRLPSLFILVFVILTANGVFLGNTIDMYSSLGVYAEPYTQAINALYIGMGIGLIFAGRMKARFSNKSLLMGGLIMMLLLNIICATTTSPGLTVVVCLLLGFSKIAALLEVYIVWNFIWSKTGDRSRLYPFVYGIALAGLYFVTWITTELTYAYNWRLSYIFILLLILICLLITVLLVENHPLKKSIPLYQVDWMGLLKLATALMFFDYAVVYAKVENGLESNKIRAALLFSFIFLLLFIRRELTVQRPFFDVTIFKIKNFRRGLIYFIVLGIFIPSTFQSSFTAVILQFEAISNAQLNLYMIPGVVIGSVTCFLWYAKKLDAEPLLFVGFLAFVIHHIILYNSFAIDFNINDFILPVILKGFAMTVLYIAIGLYTTDNLPISISISAAGMMIIIRSFLGSGIFSGVYNYLLYSERIKHFSYLAGQLDASDQWQKLQGGNHIYRNLQLQAILAASKELTGWIILSGIALLFFITGNYFYKWKKSFKLYSS
jgi:DHA2 family multidrug resistance protein